MKSWNELKWWGSEECANVHTKLEWHDYATRPQPHFQPRQGEVYKALHVTPFPSVRVVIVGQDPYPTPGMATGLAFSVPATCLREDYPPTLVNIFQELVDDLHIPYPRHGDLTAWAKQGVLLWNSALTVEPRKPGSHSKLGWDVLTQEVLSAVNEHARGVVFVLWGRDAQKHLPLVLPSVENKRHHVILAPHPSPLSARRGFFGSRPFSTINSLLKEPIDWRLK
jgi:uracil-DNA glycosylase